MQVIYDDAKDKYVASYVVYGKAADSKLYYSTAEDATQVTEEDLVDAFTKGRLIVAVVDGDNVSYFAVTKVAANKAYTLDDVSSTATITEWSAKAKA